MARGGTVTRRAALAVALGAVAAPAFARQGSVTLKSERAMAPDPADGFRGCRFSLVVQGHTPRRPGPRNSEPTLGRRAGPLVNPATPVTLWRVQLSHGRLPREAGPGLSMANALGPRERQVWARTAAAVGGPAAFNRPAAGYVLALHAPGGMG